MIGPFSRDGSCLEGGKGLPGVLRMDGSVKVYSSRLLLEVGVDGSSGAQESECRSAPAKKLCEPTTCGRVANESS